MSSAAPDTDSIWREALVEAADQLPAADPLAQVFYEERRDLRAEVEGSSDPTAVETVLRGVHARIGGANPRSGFLASPAPEDLVAVARNLDATRVIEPSDSAAVTDSVLDSGRAAAYLLRLRQRAALEAGPGRVSISARWVEFRQNVLVSRPEGEFVSDLRRSARLRVEIRGKSRSGKGFGASGEMVVPFRWRDDSFPAGPTCRRIDSLAVEVVRRAGEGSEATPASPGPHPVVFAAGAGGIVVHELIGHALEADTVLRKGSGLFGNESLPSRPGLRIIDDPRRSRGAWKTDDEGVVTKPTLLMDQGRVAGLLHDRETALRSGAEPTGHGRRSSFREPVRPRMGCTFLVAGEVPPDEIIRSTKRGLYVRRMEAASADLLSGVALFRINDADTVENGRLGAPLEPFMLRVDSRSALAGIEEIGSDLTFDTCIGSCVRDGQPLVTSVGAPTFRIGLARVVS
jgi:TldD protein